MSAITANGAVLLLGSTNVDADTVRVTMTQETTLPVVKTFSGQRTAQGTTEYTGEIQTLYEPDTTLTQHPYYILVTEADTPTSGGFTITYRPGGSGTSPSLEEYVALIRLGQPTIETDAESEDIVLTVFNFAVIGTPTRQGQS